MKAVARGGGERNSPNYEDPFLSTNPRLHLDARTQPIGHRTTQHNIMLAEEKQDQGRGGNDEQALHLPKVCRFKKNCEDSS